MAIRVLDKKTIDKIAAGEVVERPSSVVKELMENALDAGASAITVEIQNGGTDLIRVTDNGSGIPEDEVATAFLPHATSKIQSSEDLNAIMSLGFRGEALPSIAAVSRMEVITRTKSSLTGVSYEIAGGDEQGLTEIGAPEGTTVIVRSLFYNTPARRKFLKTPVTETSYVSTLMEKMALSHPYVGFRLIANKQTRLQTPGNGKVKDLIYSLYGRETARETEALEYEEQGIRISGYIGRPVITKGNRSFENYFVNGRYVKSAIIEKAAEEAYKPFLMQHMYPFFILYIEMPPEDIDVNVHPAKTEIRFRKEQEIYDIIKKAISSVLNHREFTPEILPEEKKEEKKLYTTAEPFETLRLQEDHGYTALRPFRPETGKSAEPDMNTGTGKEVLPEKEVPPEREVQPEREINPERETKSDSITGLYEKYRKQHEVPEEKKKEEVPQKTEDFHEQFREQMNVFDTRLVSDEGMKKHRLIGQVFDTYWILQMEDKMFILDQHAAHEKVIYERKMRELKERKPISQKVSPPIMVSLTRKEEIILNRCMEAFSSFGYEISSFGGREYAITAVPDDLYGADVKQLFSEILSEMEEEMSSRSPEILLNKVATASCKAAVKGNNALSFEEADTLIQELLTLENPYACPHGRPTLISLTKQDLEKRFKRIV